MRRVAIAAGFLLASLALFSAQAAAGVPWLHIHVQDGGPDPENVRVNVPASLVDAVMPEIEKKTRHESKFDVGDCEMTVAEYRRSIRSLNSSPRREVKLDNPHGTVVLKRQGPDLILTQTPKRKHRTATKVRMPWYVATALAKGAGNTLDVSGAVHALAAEGKGEIAVEKEDGSRIRVWVDEVAFPPDADV